MLGVFLLAWVVFPALMAVLSLGAGLVVRRACGTAAFSALLILPVGLATLVVVLVAGGYLRRPSQNDAPSTEVRADRPSVRGGGEATVGDKEYNDARFADEVVEAGGVGDFDAEQLGKVLAGKQVTVRTGISETTESVTAG